MRRPADDAAVIRTVPAFEPTSAMKKKGRFGTCPYVLYLQPSALASAISLQLCLKGGSLSAVQAYLSLSY